MISPLARLFAIAGLVGAVALVTACSGSSVAPGPVPVRANPFGNMGPMTSPTPIPLIQGGTIGQIVFPDGDTQAGGQGQQVDGEDCIGPIKTVPYHHHVHIELFVNNVQYAIPRALGFVAPWKLLKNGFAYAPKCKYFMHSHDASGVIHLEYLQIPTIEPTLGQVFDVWGEPFTRTNVAGYTGTETVFVNGIPYQYNPRTMGIGMNHMLITLEINSTRTPQLYNWTTY